jgi:multidrug efflux pump subunit AcrA (membrane-fusion protein)
MSRIFWTTLVTLGFLLAACGPSPSNGSPIAPVASLSATSNSSSTGSVSASVVVRPALHSQLSLLIPALVQEVDVKEGDTVQPGQTLMVLNTPELSLAVDAAAAAVRSAQAEANLRRYPRKMINGAGNVVYLSGPPELRQIADARLQQAQASLETAQILLAQGKLLAPYNGTIVTVNAVPGQFVQPGQVVAVIGDLNHLLIETTDLSERDIARIQVGQSATVRLKAFSQALSGKVVAIAPRSAISAGVLVFKVTIALDSPPPALLWGMSGTIDIQTK